MLIISVYMQCNSEKDSYNAFVECIEQLHELIFTYKGTREIIIRGDFNGNALIDNGSIHSKCFHKFMCVNGLLTKAAEQTFIYSYHNGKDASTIDFFLNTQMLVDKIMHLD